jgi:hypothetical protein
VDLGAETTRFEGQRWKRIEKWSGGQWGKIGTSKKEKKSARYILVYKYIYFSAATLNWRKYLLFSNKPFNRRCKTSIWPRPAHIKFTKSATDFFEKNNTPSVSIYSAYRFLHGN